jgi:hypothetical protein
VTRFDCGETRCVQRSTGQSPIGECGELPFGFLILGSGLGQVGADGFDRSRGGSKTRLDDQCAAGDIRLCRAGSSGSRLRRAEFQPLQTISLGGLLPSGARRSRTLLGRPAGLLGQGYFVRKHDQPVLVAQQLGGG